MPNKMILVNVTEIERKIGTFVHNVHSNSTNTDSK
jgi:hypothetical protein